MSVLVFANGELDPGDWVEAHLDNATAVIAADGGADHLLALGRTPDVVIGDLDSIAPELVERLREGQARIIIHPEMKDESDLELALRYAAEHFAEKIMIFGALGGRLDQLMANVFLLTAPFLEGRAVRIVEAYQQAWIMGEGEGRIKGEIGDRVSLLPLGGDVRIGRTSGLAWELADETLVQGMSRGISNRLTAETARVEIENGILLCVHLAAVWQR